MDYFGLNTGLFFIFRSNRLQTELMDQRLFFLNRDYGWLLGCFPGNAPHRHFTVQATVSGQPFQLHTSAGVCTTRYALIASSAEHAITAAPR